MNVIARVGVFVLAVCIFVNFSAAGAFAQATSTSSIEGKVSDTTGSVVPGVTVTISSPSLQAPQLVAVSDAQGHYRFTSLPAGVYTVTYELAGFQTQKREGLRLTVGFVATIDVNLSIGAIAESVTVTGESPTVDIRTTTVDTNLSHELLAAVPTALSVNETMKLAEGVHMMGVADVGGSNTGGNTEKWKTYGTQLGGIRSSLDGIDTHYFTNSFPGYFDISSLDEVQVKAMGMDAEAGVPGVQLNAIIKSGGNAFHGTGSGYFEGKQLEGNNVDSALAATGVTPATLNSYRDTFGELGGRIVRDRLWFYGAAHQQQYSNNVIGYVGNNVGGTTQYTGKLSGSLSTNMKFNAFYQYSEKAFPQYTGSAFKPFASTFNYTFPTPAYKVEWTYTPTNHSIIDFYAGRSWYTATYRANGTGPASSDLVTLQTWGAATPNKTPRNRYQYTGSYSYYKAAWAGDHDLKIGGEITDEFTGQITPPRFGVAELGGDFAQIFNGGAPFEVTLQNTPLTAEQDLTTQKLFIRDNWKATGRLSMNLGIRWERYHGWVPAQSHVAGQFPTLYPAASFPEVEALDWKNFAPRVGVAYALTADNKTALKATWGRYNWLTDPQDYGIFNGNNAASTTYRWNDTNSDGTFEPGEQGAFVSSTGALTNVVNPDLKEPITYEATATLERELGRDLLAKVAYVYRDETQIFQSVNTLRPYSAYNIPITGTDPVTGNQITYYDYSAAYRGSAFVLNENLNLPGLTNSYHNIETGVSKRLSKGWQMQATLLFTKTDAWGTVFGSGQGVLGAISGVPTPLLPQDPNAAIYPKVQTWENSLRISGSYQLPSGIQLAGVVDHQSGFPYARTILFTAGLKQLSSVIINAEPVGADSLPAQNLVTVRAEKTFKFGNSQTLSVKFDVYNLLNAAVTTAISTQTGPTYGKITGLLGPRIAGFGLTYKF